MSRTSDPGPAPTARALREAAEWRVLLADRDLPEKEREAFAAWLDAHPDHARAWQELQTTWDAFADVQRPRTRAALEQVFAAERQATRRLLRRGIATVLVLVPAVGLVLGLGLGIASPRHLLADHHTAIGERLTVDLPDGSTLVIDTASAVDIRFDAQQRTVRLIDGRMFIDVAPDPGRPLAVIAGETRVRALGTRFSVSRVVSANDDRVGVSVYESRVELCPGADAAGCRQLRDGEAADTVAGVVGNPVGFKPPGEPAWVAGYLEAERRPLGDVLAELARYHRGLLYYDAAQLAGLEVSGILPLDDPDQALSALATTLPIRVARYTPWVIRVTRTPR